jgi:hypothetical protein
VPLLLFLCSARDVFDDDPTIGGPVEAWAAPDELWELDIVAGWFAVLRRLGRVVDLGGGAGDGGAGGKDRVGVCWTFWRLDRRVADGVDGCTLVLLLFWPRSGDCSFGAALRFREDGGSASGFVVGGRLSVAAEAVEEMFADAAVAPAAWLAVWRADDLVVLDDMSKCMVLPARQSRDCGWLWMC